MGWKEDGGFPQGKCPYRKCGQAGWELKMKTILSAQPKKDLMTYWSKIGG